MASLKIAIEADRNISEVFMVSGFKKILVAVVLISSVTSVHAEVATSDQILQNIYSSTQRQGLGSRSKPERLAFFAHVFFNKKSPYLADPLGEGERGEISKAPLYRFDAFDCTTFVETVLALTLASSPEDFRIRINQIRYKDGVISYQTRNHFSSLDWIPNNIKNGFVKDVTGAIAGKHTKWSQTWIDKGEWLKRKGPQYEGMSLEFKPALAQLPYISKEDILASSELVERIPSGSIFHVIRPNWDLKKAIGTQLDVSHMGFLVREQGVLYMIHASNGASRDGSDGALRVKKERFLEYVQRVMMSSSTTAGINVLAISQGTRSIASLAVDKIKNTDVESQTAKQKIPSVLADIPETDVIGEGVLKPTVYYFPVLDEDKNPCPEDSKKIMHGAGGKVLLNICPKTEQACNLQGSCGVIQNGVMQSFNIIGRFGGQERFFKIEDQCQMGYGVKSICLDPYYTLAADLTLYKPGEVIFVPAVVGLELPDGTLHHGFFVIRDSGRGIKGHGRFDFFSGQYSWRNPENPFKKLRLGDVNTNIPYYRISGEVANMIRLDRGFPNLPDRK